MTSYTGRRTLPSLAGGSDTSLASQLQNGWSPIMPVTSAISASSPRRHVMFADLTDK